MGKIAHLQEGLGQIKTRLAEANKREEIRRGELDALLDGRFNKVSDRLEGALSRLMSESDKAQNQSLTAAVDGVVNAVSAVQDGLRDALGQISQEVALSQNIVSDDVDNSAIQVSARIQALQDDISTRLDRLDKLAGGIKMPAPTDITPVMAMLENLKIPDPSGQIKKLEQRINKRVYEFHVERNTYNDLIEKIVVVEK